MEDIEAANAGARKKIAGNRVDILFRRGKISNIDEFVKGRIHQVLGLKC